MRTIKQPEADIPVIAETDVLVCGGGVSGVTAAVSAARHGAKAGLPFDFGRTSDSRVQGMTMTHRERVMHALGGR